MSAWRTHLRTDSTPNPTGQRPAGPCRDRCPTRRATPAPTAQPAPFPPRNTDATTTGPNPLLLPWLHSRFQAQEPPPNPGRFIGVLTAILITGCSGITTVESVQSPTTTIPAAAPRPPPRQPPQPPPQPPPDHNKSNRSGRNGERLPSRLRPVPSEPARRRPQLRGHRLQKHPGQADRQRPLSPRPRPRRRGLRIVSRI